LPDSFKTDAAGRHSLAGMSEPSIDAFIEQYVAVWNEPDLQARHASIRRLWARDGSMVNRVRRYAGHAAIIDGVGRSYDAFVVRGFRFEPEHWCAHHDALLFLWLMRDACGEVDSRGVNYIAFDEAGRIVLDHQFNGLIGA
jgi:uncharacterized protein